MNCLQWPCLYESEVFVGASPIRLKVIDAGTLVHQTWVFYVKVLDFQINTNDWQPARVCLCRRKDAGWVVRSHFSLSLSPFSLFTSLLYVQSLALVPGTSCHQTVEDLLLMPAAASGCLAQLIEQLSSFLLRSACSWNFLSCLDAFSLWLTLNYLELLCFHPMGEAGLFAVTSQYLWRGSLKLKYGENSLLMLCLDALLVGEAHWN